MKQYAQRGIIAAAVILLGSALSTARADCPDDICECIGEAGQFALVSTKAKIRQGVISASGYGEPVPTYIETSMCSSVGKVGGKPGGETEIEEDALFTAATEIAVKFSGSKGYGEIYPGAFIAGDVATGGGSVAGQSFADIGGVVDTTGTHPFIEDCALAISDAATGSAALAALTPTQSLGDLIITGESTYDITVGSAEVAVIEVDKLIIKPRKSYGYAYGSTLNINLDGTNSVVINAKKLAVGSSCQIIINGGDVEDVIINVPGTGPSVRIARDSYVTVPILAPERKIVASANSFCTNLFAGKLIVKGSTISETMFCP